MSDLIGRSVRVAGLRDSETARNSEELIIPERGHDPQYAVDDPYIMEIVRQQNERDR